MYDSSQGHGSRGTRIGASQGVRKRRGGAGATIGSTAGGSRRTEYLYEWQAILPSDSRILIQVIASTDGEAAEFQSVPIRQTAKAQVRPRRLYVLAAGVNEYRDAQIQKLDFAANNARRVAEGVASIDRDDRYDHAVE